jgi:hypothetical protein
VKAIDGDSGFFATRTKWRKAVTVTRIGVSDHTKVKNTSIK